MNLQFVSADNRFKIYCENDLEVHRANSLRTKEPETVQWIEEFFNNDDVFFDIGANIGIYSLLAASTHKNLNVYSFEPFFKNFYRLNQNIELNQLTGKMHTFPVALSDTNKISYFYSKDTRSGASGGQIDQNVDEHGKKFNVENKQSILTFVFDDLLEFFKLPAPHHIKIDVDGVEDLIIKGMKKTFRHPSLRSLLIELNHDSKAKEELTRELESLGLTLKNKFHMSDNHSRLRRVNNPNNKAENLIFIRQ
jgi:FkbM family methyltransferase